MKPASSWFDDNSVLDRRTILLLLFICAVGSFFRVWDLGLSPFRADTGLFWELCHQNITGSDVYARWLKALNLQGVLPFPAAFTVWFINGCDLTPTHFTVRLPSALWGIAAVPAMFGLARAFGGVRFGLVAAFLLAIHPYHIQVSRESYFYPPLVTGSILGFWAALWMFNHLHRGAKITLWFHLVNGAGFFLLTHSQPSGWPFALLICLTFGYAAIYHFVKNRRIDRAHIIVFFTYLVIGLPLLTAEWGLKSVMLYTSGPYKEHNLRIFGLLNQVPFLASFWRTITSYAWGDTIVRSLFLLVVLVLAGAVILKRWKQDKRILVLVLFLGICFAMNMYSRHSTGWPFASRYIVVLLPLYLMVLTVGVFAVQILWRPVLGKLGRFPIPSTGVGAAVAVVLWLPGSWASTQITGKPTPYKIVNTWVDANLPPRTPVLVDRWFEPWCELRIDTSTNVLYTYTVPDEPLDVFRQVRWRDTATNFFHRFPEAAYYEIIKHYFDVPDIGPWEWPRQFFTRRVAFTNEAGMTLRNLGLAYREDFYAANTNRLVVELFYNTRDDVLRKAQSQGQTLLALPGDGWTYTKTQDYRDWRMLQASATIELHNFSDSTNDVSLVIRAVAASAAKQVQFGNVAHLFPANQLVEYRLGPFPLPPGLRELKLVDESWQKARVPLLVEGFRLEDTRALP